MFTKLQDELLKMFNYNKLPIISYQIALTVHNNSNAAREEDNIRGTNWFMRTLDSTVRGNQPNSIHSFYKRTNNYSEKP